MRPALLPVVLMVRFTVAGDVVVTVAGEKEQLDPMGRFAHANVKV
jgi:hypothetical protein